VDVKRCVYSYVDVKRCVYSYVGYYYYTANTNIYMWISEQQQHNTTQHNTTQHNTEAQQRTEVLGFLGLNPTTISSWGFESSQLSCETFPNVS